MRQAGGVDGDGGAELEVVLGLADRALPGLLSIPPDPAGIVVFAHGSGSSRLSPRNQAVAIPRPNAIDINIASEFGLIMVDNASGTITFREGATELTVYGIPKEKLPELGTVVKIWGISLETEEGRFFLPNAKCTGHGSGILDGSATFLQLVVPPSK